MINKTEPRDIEVFLNYSMRNFFDGKDVSQSITEDLDYISFVKQISNICKSIISCKNPPLVEERRVVVNGNGLDIRNKTSKTGIPVKVVTKAGEYVLSIVDNYRFCQIQKDKRIRFSPVVRLFFDCVRRFELEGLDNHYKKSAVFLMALEKDIRNESKRLGIHKRINDDDRAAKKNYMSAVKYANKLFDMRSRILVVRLDLSYTEEYVSNLGPDSYNDVKSHREQLIKSLPNLVSVEDCMLGYIWKLEYGLVKSYHYHCIVFLDGSKVRQSITIGKIIGEKWKDITKKQGIYFNCNAKMDQYKYNGIGAIDRGDTEKRQCLNNVIYYITKPDCHIKAAVPDGARIFGKGEITKEMLAIKRKIKAG